MSLAVDGYDSPAAPSDAVRSFQQLLADYKGGYLQIPEHQRDANVWDFAKKKRYVDRLRDSATGRHPPGCFATYQLVGPDKRAGLIYLNDGFQRLTTLRDLQADPARFSMDEESVRRLLRLEISVCHRWYGDHPAAMIDFQLINNGTQLTSKELLQGYIKYMPNYQEQWRDLIANVEETIKHSESRLLRKTQENREAQHKRDRNTLAIFYRFLTGERRPIAYLDVPARVGNIQRYVEKGQVVELMLKDKLIEKGYPEAERRQRDFRRFVEHETATIFELVRAVLGPSVGLVPVAHRWLLDLAVWAKNNKVPREQHQQFVRKFLERTGGKGQWVPDDSRQGAVTLGFSALGPLPGLAVLAGMPEFCETGRRRRHRSALQPGYDNSHLDPVSTHGEGDVFGEPAPLNRSRGARSVKPEELPHDGP